MKIARQHYNYVGMWYDNICLKTLEVLNKQGYHDPTLYACSYNYNTGEYATTLITMEADALSNPERQDFTLNCLKTIEKNCDFTLLGIVFVSEGTTKMDEEGNRDGFLVITFEDKIKGWKKVYQLKKQIIILDGGKTSLKIEDLFYDEEKSTNYHSVMLERFAHILRPNYYDKTDLVYN
jgi:hypothetical protein